MATKIILPSILLFLLSFHLHAQSEFTLELERLSVDCNATQVCYAINLSSVGDDFRFAGANLRIFYDGDILGYSSFTTSLSGPYTTGTGGGNGSEGDQTGNGTLDFDDNLGLLNLTITISNTAPENDAELISSTPVTIGEVCMNLEAIGGTDCVDLVFVREPDGTNYGNVPGNFIGAYNGAGMINSVVPSSGIFGDLEDCLLNSDCPLPVEFTTFNGVAEKCNNTLKWSTASEINNDRFEVEHSIGAKEFERLKTMKGAGTTFEPQTYTFTHENAPVGNNYYRIKQIDIDGTVDYSNVIAVESDCSDIEDEFAVYPNPVGDEGLRMTYQVTKEHEAEIEILDITGKQIIRRAIQAQRGENVFQLNTSALAAGTYYVSLYRNGIQFKTEKIIKMKE